MKYTTYILASVSRKKTHVGFTTDISRRLIEHNRGNSFFTRKYRPWKVIYTEIFKTREESIKKEKYFKSAAGRKWMKKHLFSIIQDD